MRRGPPKPLFLLFFLLLGLQGCSGLSIGIAPPSFTIEAQLQENSVTTVERALVLHNPTNEPIRVKLWPGKLEAFGLVERELVLQPDERTRVPLKFTLREPENFSGELLVEVLSSGSDQKGDVSVGLVVPVKVRIHTKFVGESPSSGASHPAQVIEKNSAMRIDHTSLGEESSRFSTSYPTWGSSDIPNAQLARRPINPGASHTTKVSETLDVQPTQQQVNSSPSHPTQLGEKNTVAKIDYTGLAILMCIGMLILYTELRARGRFRGA